MRPIGRESRRNVCLAKWKRRCLFFISPPFIGSGRNPAHTAHAEVVGALYDNLIIYFFLSWRRPASWGIVQLFARTFSLDGHNSSRPWRVITRKQLSCFGRPFILGVVIIHRRLHLCRIAFLRRLSNPPSSQLTSHRVEKKSESLRHLSPLRRRWSKVLKTTKRKASEHKVRLY